MGTRGWWVLLYKGVYYRFYNNFDSYFVGLGKELINELIQGGDTLLQNLGRVLDLSKVVVVDDEIHGGTEAFLGPPDDETLKAEWESLHTIIPWDLRKALENHDEDWLNGDGLFIEYIYVIDLDRTRFYASCESSGFIFSYRIDETLKPEYMDLADERMVPDGVGAKDIGGFPFPRIIQDKVQDDLKGMGYQLDSPEPVSTGSSAQVFRAVQMECGKKVFTKIFKVCWARGGWGPYEIGGEYTRSLGMARMLMECKPQCPHVVGILNARRLTLPILILEAFDGDLKDVLDNRLGDASATKKMAVACRALADVALGIRFLHGKGVVHHDVKPLNILVQLKETPDEFEVRAALCDFESVGVPFKNSPNGLTWGPFGETRFFSDEKDPRWVQGWTPLKRTRNYAHPEYKSPDTDPWCLDEYCLSVVLEEYLDKYEPDIESESEKQALDAVRKECIGLLRSKDPQGNLGEVSDILKKFACSHLSKL